MNEAAKPGSKRSRPAESAKPCAWRASVESKFKLAPAIALSYVAHGQAWSRRIMVSVWVRALTRDCRSALRRVKSNERGDACSIRFDAKAASLVFTIDMDRETINLLLNGEYSTEHGKLDPDKSIKPFLSKTGGRKDDLYITFSFYNAGTVQITDQSDSWK